MRTRIIVSFLIVCAGIGSAHAAPIEELIAPPRVTDIKLNAPVFIAHGKSDRRAPYKHATRLKKALDRNHKPYEWFVKRGESHGFYDTENELEYLESVLAFLKKHTR